MAQAAMIIHTRTRLCDFPSTFAVCPSAFGSGDVQKVRKQVLAATRSIDSMGQNEVRQMVYTCGDLVIAGMVSFLKNLSSNNDEDEKFFYDEKGRGIYAFVGFVLKANNQSLPFINKKILWESFKGYMEPIWERTVLDTQLSNFKEVDFQITDATEPTSGKSVSGMTLYIKGTDDTSIFLYWLSQALKGKSVSFCSNIIDFKVVKDKPFNIITTTSNIIDRLKKENIPPSHTPSISPHRQLKDNEYGSSYADEKKNSIQKENSTVGKNSSKMWPIIAAVVFMVIIVIILISK